MEQAEGTQEKTGFHVQFGKPSKMTKVEVYGWQVLDAPGDFQRIDKRLLRVDHTYQRDHRLKRSRDMARSWSYIKCGTISVTYRDGVWYVIDGQHRLGGAMLRDDVTDLPCMVYKIASVQEEARFFYESNTLHKQPRMAERFRALLAMEDSTAIFVKGLIDGANYEIGSSSHGRIVKCVAAMMKCAEQDRAALLVVWPMVVRICEGRPIHERLLQGLHYIQARSSGLAGYEDAVFREGYEGLLSAANRAVTYKTAGGPKIWALGMLEVINKRRRHRLELPGK